MDMSNLISTHQKREKKRSKQNLGMEEMLIDKVGLPGYRLKLTSNVDMFLLVLEMHLELEQL
jgi:hypothetical protein